jgi:vacuolar-type H+-ATPase subunit F/Vma7
MDSKAAVLGSADFVMAFSAIGLDTFAVEANAEEVTEAAKTILAEKYGLVVVAENVTKMANEVFGKTEKLATPCIVTVPFLTESTGEATAALGRALKIATGIDILGN